MQPGLELFRDKIFLLTHLVLPTVIFLLLAWLFEHTPVDLWLANLIFSWEGGAWTLRQHWFTYQVMHHWGNLFIYQIGLLAGLSLVLGLRWQRWEKWRAPASYLLVCMVLIPSTVALLKRFSGVPCPWDLSNFGGSLVYRHSLDYAFAQGAAGHCFPAGHASAGFVLLALYFAVFPLVRKRRWVYLLPGLLTGLSFGLAQQLRGAHFISHDLWTAFIAWIMALAIFGLFQWRHQVKYAGAGTPGQPDSC